MHSWSSFFSISMLYYKMLLYFMHSANTHTSILTTSHTFWPLVPALESHVLWGLAPDTQGQQNRLFILSSSRFLSIPAHASSHPCHVVRVISNTSPLNNHANYYNQQTLKMHPIFKYRVKQEPDLAGFSLGFRGAWIPGNLYMEMEMIAFNSLCKFMFKSEITFATSETC